MDRGNPTTFKLSFPKLPEANDITDNNPFLLQLYETVLPDITLDPAELGWKGQKSLGSGINLTFGSGVTSFYIDEDFNNYILMYDGLIGILNGIKPPFHPEKILDYQVDCSMLIMDNFENVIKKFKFVNVFPIGLGEVTLSYQNADTYLTCLLTLGYDYFIKDDD